METKLVKILKSYPIQGDINATNLEELSVSLGEYIKKIVDVLNKNNEESEKIFNALYEENLRCHALVTLTFKLIGEKLKSVYGLSIDIDQLHREAAILLTNNWPEIKKNFLEYADTAKKIDDIFNQNNKEEQK